MKSIASRINESKRALRHGSDLLNDLTKLCKKRKIKEIGETEYDPYNGGFQTDESCFVVLYGIGRDTKEVKIQINKNGETREWGILFDGDTPIKISEYDRNGSTVVTANYHPKHATSQDIDEFGDILYNLELEII